MFPGSNAITYTDATPTVPELRPKLVVAVRQVAANRFTRATHLILSPLAWGWLRAALDTAGRPLFAVGGSETGMNAMGTAQGGGAGYDVNGRMLGCDVVISGNVPANLGGGSNETRIIAADMREVYLWELSASPIFIRAEQPNAASLGIRYVAYRYSAFGAGNRRRSPLVSGTGMILPAL